MKIKKDLKIFRLLEGENLGHRFFRPLLQALAICAITFFLMTFVVMFIPENIGNELIVKLPLGGFIIALILFLYASFRLKENIGMTAVRIDRKQKAKSRLEAAYELSDENSPISDAQIENAEGFFQNDKNVNWKLILIGLTFLVLIMLTSQITLLLLVKQGSISFQPFKKKDEIALKTENKGKKKKKKEKEIPGFAELLMLEPEPEKKAMLLEAIAWRCKANSTHGFKNIELALSINGEEVKRIPIIKNKKNGVFFLEGEFYLDDIKAKPFDLVSYSIYGTSKMNFTENQEIISPPNFIEMRPFKEDSLFERVNANGEGKDELGIIYKIMKTQIKLNRETIHTKGSGMSHEDKLLQQKVELLAGAQNELMDELEKLLESKKVKLDDDQLQFSANVFHCLQQAIEKMKNATKHLNDVKKYRMEE